MYTLALTHTAMLRERAAFCKFMAILHLKEKKDSSLGTQREMKSKHKVAAEAFARRLMLLLLLASQQRPSFVIACVCVCVRKVSFFGHFPWAVRVGEGHHVVVTAVYC